MDRRVNDMAIDEIIAAERDNAEFSKANNYDKSADYHNQIAELLEELKAMKEMDLDIPQHFTKEQSDWIKAYCIRRNIEFCNKAIDDFAEKLKRENKETIPTHSGYCRMIFDEVVEEIEEKLKAGGKNEKEKRM